MWPERTAKKEIKEEKNKKKIRGEYEIKRLTSKTVPRVCGRVAEEPKSDWPVPYMHGETKIEGGTTRTGGLKSSAMCERHWYFMS